MGAESEDNWSLPLYFQIKTGKCEICGELHAVERCSLTDGFTDYMRDSPSLSYARLTLPEGLEVRELADGSKTVVAAQSFSKGLKFGPFVAKTSSLIDVRIEFPLKVFLSEEESVYLETYEEIFCNWMCLVLPASSTEEQNLICFQIKTSIYFCSLRNIEKGEELRVWYAPYYADRMGARSFPKPPDLIHSSDEEFQEIFESLQSGVEMQDHQYLPKLKTRRKPPKKLVLSENYYREVPPSDVLPGELLGAVRRSEWECSTCGQAERSVAAYARHLMTHCRPPLRPSFRCTYCNRNFRKDGYNRQVHLEICRRNKLKESVRGEANQSNLSRMTFIARTVDSDAVAKSEFAQEVKNDCELSLDSSDWNQSVMCDKPDDNSANSNDQIITQSVSIHVKQELVHSDEMSNCEVETPTSVTTNKSIANIGWSISDQKDTCGSTETGTEQLVCSSADGKNDKDKNDNSFEQLQNSEENLDENLLVKSHLNPPILDLSDDIDFHLTKSLDEMINEDCNIEKSLPFSKNRSLDLFGGVEANLLASDVPDPNNSSLETTSFYPLEKNEFLQPDFVSCNDVTDEERNRIVENLLSETDDKFFASDYEMTDGCVSENTESQAKVGQSSMENAVEKDKESRTKAGGDFKCDICTKCFTKPFYLYRHLRKHTGEFRCNTCFMVFARKETLQKHRLVCANEADTQQTIRRVRVFCKFCQLQFHSLTTLQEHMEEHYCTGDTWQCVCKEISNSPDVFLSHKCPFSKTVKSCTTCSKKFSSPQEFVEHRNHPILKVKGKSDRSLLCEFCGAMNSTLTGARLHRNSVHGKKSHRCSVCGKGFSRLDKLTEHSHKHENVFWECPVCSKKYPSEKLCIRHQKNMHINPSFSCTFCNKKFRQKCNYQRHLRVHEREKTFDCTVCDLKFPTIKSLNSHLREKHVNDAFVCDKCNRVFSRLWRLKAHIRDTHNEVYKCTYCQVEIRFRSHLKKHLNAYHKDKTEEWNNTKALLNMRTYNAREADLHVEEEMDEAMTNVNPIISNILQTATDEVMAEDNLNTIDNAEETTDGDTPVTMIDQLSTTNFVAAIVQGNATDESNSHEMTFDLNVIRGSDNRPQLVSVDGEVLTMPLAFVSDLPSPGLITSDDQSSMEIGQGGMLSYPVVLPQGCLLTLDNGLIEKPEPEESSALINVSDFQTISGATTSAYVLTDETVAESNLQIQNNVLYYIVDSSVSDAVE